MRKTFRPVRLALALVLALFIIGLNRPGPLKAEVTDSGVRASVGGVNIKLLNPSGMIHVDGLHEGADAALKSMLTPEGARLLAVYAEPITWFAFKNGLSPEGPKVPLNYYATITTPDKLAGRSISLEEFSKLKDENVKPTAIKYGAETLKDRPDFVTYIVTTKGPDGVVLKRQVTTTTTIVVGAGS